MNPAAYRNLCQRRDVLSRSILEDTLVEVRKKDSEVSIRLHTILMGPPIPKPNEDEEFSMDYFEISLTEYEKHTVVKCLLNSQKESDEGWLSSLLDTWSAMVEY